MGTALRVLMAGGAVAALFGCSDAAVPADGSLTQEMGIPRAEQPVACPDEGAALQVLGSGGPIAKAGRAGTSYLLWIDGEPRLLIDAGSGSFLRFAEAGGKIESLDAILLTHLHADHVGDLIDVLNSGGFEGRSDPLAIVGPDAAPRFPGTIEFLARLLSKENGAFAYNGGYLDGTENKPPLEPRDIATSEGTAGPAGLDVPRFERRLVLGPVEIAAIVGKGPVLL
ncbi:MAG: MBL fold metallo-hydrolase [Erythrobacter sp.]|nr:MBL fold metallo-hydrolase [Erythrobacter sp.]